MILGITENHIGRRLELMMYSPWKLEILHITIG